MDSTDRPEARERRTVRRRILSAAYVVIGQQGIAASTLDEVAVEAGVDIATIHSHFIDKDDVVLALHEEHVMHRLSAAADCFVEADDRDQALANVGQLLVEAMHIDAPAHRLLAENYATTFRDPQRRAALAARRREAHDAVARVLTRLQDLTGLPLVLPPEETAVVLLALSNGLGIEAGLNPDAVPKDLPAQILRMLVESR